MSGTWLSERAGAAAEGARPLEPAPGGLTTDLYELTMAASVLRRGMTGPATFSLFLRRLPADRGFVVAAGLDDCLRFLEDFHFEPDELDYLSGLGFDEQAIEHFRRLRFTGSVRAVPEGTVVFADEPILEVTADRLATTVSPVTTGVSDVRNDGDDPCRGRPATGVSQGQQLH